MDARFGLGLIGALILAAVIGIIAARSQPQSIAAPVPTATATPLPAPAPGTVNIEGSRSGSSSGRYNPSIKTVHVGQKITWVNVDTVAHTVTFDDGSFDSGVLSAGQRATWTARKAGTYTYGDFLHPDMRGVVVVQP